MNRLTIATLTFTAAIAALAGVGCATKKYVSQTIAPVQTKVDELDKKTTAKDTSQDNSIVELEKGVSRADERAQGADKRAEDAAREAARANEQAAVANKQAGAAQGLAEKGISQATQAEHSVGTLGIKVENMDNFKLATSEAVLFAVGKSELTKDAMAQLDGLAAKAVAIKHYMIEVHGFTDSTGAASANLQLSERRAAAVVRYLTLEGKVPSLRVTTVGYGAASPAADNKTRDGRKQNRRVQVSLYIPDVGM